MGSTTCHSLGPAPGAMGLLHYGRWRNPAAATLLVFAVAAGKPAPTPECRHTSYVGECRRRTFSKPEPERPHRPAAQVMALTVHSERQQCSCHGLLGQGAGQLFVELAGLG